MWAIRASGNSTCSSSVCVPSTSFHAPPLAFLLGAAVFGVGLIVAVIASKTRSQGWLVFGGALTVAGVVVMWSGT